MAAKSKIKPLPNNGLLFPDHANAKECLILSGWVHQGGNIWLRLEPGRVGCATFSKLSDGRAVFRTLPGIDITTAIKP